MHDDHTGAIERAARSCLARTLDTGIAPADIGLDLDMVNEYGLSSLNKVLFVTAVCDATGVGVGNFTEHDLAALRTLRDVVAALSRHALAGEAAAR
ncbi:MAG TPA: acyl carrier protein [Actinophytocola sp.]|uniref:acyl carrier protein n=1 Tax=Actinophytocola sp. TaxID=1872138 RepID=UPI002DB74A93|nr:acyl carrier protein [Actinophytocola sp.]HEU5470230.1 acyl carrier protein [Actinophytocola sp.]